MTALHSTDTLERLNRLVREHPEVARALANIGDVAASDAFEASRAKAAQLAGNVDTMALAVGVQSFLTMGARAVAMVAETTRLLDGTIDVDITPTTGPGAITVLDVDGSELYHAETGRH